ncbi:MAG: hypothetical protein H6797_04195 [Candidatus Nomurabacteria bacterium]|nr:MAG: hypothetical protein H6797_04195 [Candidatus Nomurabacteria bacterium]
MSEFGARERSEYEKQQDAVIALVERVNDVLLSHARTQSLDVVELHRSEVANDESDGQNELMRMSAKSHVHCLAAFYKRLYPDATSVRLEDGVHSALPLHDAVTGNKMMLLATTLILAEGRSLQAVSVTVRDEYVLSGSTVYMNDDGRFETMSSARSRDDELINEALELVGAGKRDMVLPLLSGAMSPNDLTEGLNALRNFVAEHYDQAETERFMQAIETRYHDKRRSEATAKELGLLEMSADEIEELLTTLESVEDLP